MRVLRHLSWAVPLLVGAALLCINIAEPWTGSYDANGALFSTAARNTLRYGLVTTRGGQVVNAGRLAPDQFRFYAHHPPGISLTVAGSFAVFGVHEWSARLVPIACTLGAAALLYLVATELAGAWAGFFATLVFVVQPMVAFYGRMPDHEAPAAFFALALVACYLRWQRTERKAWLVAMCAAAFVGLWYAWVVFVVPWLLLGHHLLTTRRGWRWMLLPAGAAVLGFLSVLGHIAWIEGGLAGLWGALGHRLGAQAGDRAAEGTFGLGGFVARQAAYWWTCFSGVSLAACVAWALGLGRRSRSEALLVIALLLFGLFNVVAFKQGAFVHIYYQFYLALPLALAAGLALDGLRRRRVKGRPLVAVSLLAAALIAGEGWPKLTPIRWAVIPQYTDQVSLASWLKERTTPDDRVLVVWRERSSFSQLTYYADRNLVVAPDRVAADRLATEHDFTKWAICDPVSGGYLWREELKQERPSPPARPPGR